MEDSRHALPPIQAAPPRLVGAARSLLAPIHRGQHLALLCKVRHDPLPLALLAIEPAARRHPGAARAAGTAALRRVPGCRARAPWRRVRAHRLPGLGGWLGHAMPCAHPDPRSGRRRDDRRAAALPRPGPEPLPTREARRIWLPDRTCRRRRRRVGAAPPFHGLPFHRFAYRAAASVARVASEGALARP